MRTDIAVEKLCDVTPILADMLAKLKEDENYKTFITQKGDNTTFVLKILPILFHGYSQEIYEILAIFFDKSAEEIKEQPFFTTFNQCKELLSDKDFKDFFSLLARTPNTAEE